uniref:Interferon stimulated exonuclease gene n=1 Tax=Poecilia reticulata TaxID=8081 RepID=A0A3P9NGH1_POERE
MFLFCCDNSNLSPNKYLKSRRRFYRGILCPPAASVVALDCEMVGTGPGGRCSALGRCSIVDYHGNVLYDKYVRPCQPVTDFRTPWSGIRRHHLHNAVPFAQAQEEILAILEGKVVVGHSIYNDFEVLNMDHPSHMVRDTSTTRHLRRLAGFPHGRRSSLKLLANKLLNRRIQVRAVDLTSSHFLISEKIVWASRLHSGAVGRAVALQQEGSRFDSRLQ